MAITIGALDLRAIGEFDFRLYAAIDPGGAGNYDR
jgi:hypothetical protein